LKASVPPAATVIGVDALRLPTVPLAPTWSVPASIWIPPVSPVAEPEIASVPAPAFVRPVEPVTSAASVVVAPDATVTVLSARNTPRKASVPPVTV
jgi:hypothetical protein